MKRLHRSAPAVAAAALMLAGPAVAQLTLSDTPLFLSTSVTPNVMLLFDNSGSMDNVIWDDGFDPATTYRDWSLECAEQDVCLRYDRRGRCREWGTTTSCDAQRWSATDGNVHVSEVSRSDDVTSCSAGWKLGRKAASGSGATRCLKLPDPVGSGSTRYNGNYLNYLFETYADGTDLTASGTIPQDTRLMTAKDVSTGLIDDNSDLRWGLARFNAPTNSDSGPGGKVVQGCGTEVSTVTDAIDGLSANSNTPLAETFYEVTRYFRGLGSSYNSGVSYTSPIQYRCQKNFVIAVTDGFPTYDNSFPTDDPDDATDTGRSLPNWDNLAPSTSPSDYPLFRQYSDGYKPSGSQGNEGYTLYLDDLARFGHDIDLRQTGNDLTGVSFNDTTFRVQRLQTYTVGLALNNQMLQDAAAYGDGSAYTANNATQLRDVLQRALKEIAAATSAAASIATNSTRLTADTAIYQARFRTGDWSGQLLALPIESDGQVGDPLWDAAQQIPAEASRNLYTYDPTANANNRGVAFEWARLNSTQKAALNTDASGTTDSSGQARLSFLRGDRSNEGSAGLQFRARGSVLGDIVNSDPAFVGQQDYGFDALPGSEGSGYATFRATSSYRNRPSTIYVGSNDGMLHGFRATDGVELMGYVPDLVYDRLSALTDPDYDTRHKYLVDGSMKALDAYLSNGWKTILVGATGGGGRGVFALDVTDPESFAAGDVMWEFGATQDADMGYSYPQPTIARLADGSWAAVVANGYNSGSGKAVLFLLDLADGSVIRKFDTGVAGNNGLSSPIPVDVDNDRITDLIYAGDLQGNLWKFDVRGNDRDDWTIAFGTAGSPQPLFTACTADPCTSSNRQPITARPEVGLNDASVTGHDGYVVYVGTGRYFATGDNTTSGPANTFYGLYDVDDGAGTSGIGGRGDLLQQSVVATQTLSFDNGISEDVRVTSDNTPSGERGWYLDLPLAGERQVSTPILRNESIIFTTLIPNTAACSFGGDSYLMELDALTGSRLADTPFDLNRDQDFDQNDYAAIDGERIPVSGRRSSAGIIKTPAIIAASGFEIKLASGTTGGIDTTYEPPAGPDQGGRLSWRQMR